VPCKHTIYRISGKIMNDKLSAGQKENKKICEVIRPALKKKNKF
jgi:hypothetical protein